MDARGMEDEEAARLLSQASSVQAELLVSRGSSLAVGHRAQTAQDGASTARARRCMYASHALSTWGARAWEFAVGLIMLELHPTSLLYVSLFGLLDAAALVVFGAAVGAYVDRVPRLTAAQRMYMLQNTMVAASAAAALALLLASVRSGLMFYCLLAVAMAAGAASSLGCLGTTLSVEREWTRALCGADSAALARLNAGMKRIDLICLIASPIAVGLLMTYGGSRPMVTAALAILGWNMAVWVPECALLRYAQRCSPVLSAPKPTHAAESPGAPATLEPGGGKARARGAGGWAGPLRRQWHAWAGYARQGVAPAALALALLYLTVLSFGTLMTAYLKWRGMSEAELSVYRGFGALSGVLATLTFPALQRTLGLVLTGAAAVWAQLLCLLCATLPALASLLGAPLPNRGVLLALVWGLVLSRFGLWTFDLIVNQLIQETVDHSMLGSFNGVQGSLQSLFQMLACAAGAVVWQPEHFAWLMAGSCAMVGAAAALYTSFAVVSRCGRALPGLRPRAVPAPLEDWEDGSLPHLDERQ